jgi:glucose uptake protein
MIVPLTYTAVLAAGLITLICWGLWANTLASSMRKWRFEFYYCDFALASVVVSGILLMTLGSFGGGITAYENLMIVRRKLIFLAFMAGFVFGISNILLGAASAVAGIAAGFLASFAVGLSARIVWYHLASGKGEPIAVAAAAIASLAAAILAIYAYRLLRSELELTRLQKAAAKPGSTASPEHPSAGLGAALSFAAGFLFSVLFPMVNNARNDMIEFGPYPLAVLFSAGMLISTILANFFFTNLPVRGKPVSMLRYFKGSFGQHIAGWIGGLLWTCGFVALLASQAAPPEAGSTLLLRHAFVFASPVLPVISGLAFWKEFRASGAAAGRLAAGLALFAASSGIAWWTFSPSS